jgi:uncharacterized membrane protein YhhN
VLPLTSIPVAAELWACVTLVALGLHLYAEHREWRPVVAATKLVASTGFLLVAHAAGAFTLDWGRWLFAGLLLSWVGDACLLSRGRPAFLAGLVAFLLGHVGYCVAFVVHGVDAGAAMLVAPILIVAALIVDRWLRDRVDANMRAPVRAYILVISIMLALAFAAWREGASPLLVLGAFAFYLSDLSVARDRFVRPELLNRLWGLPAYYLGQLCLALSLLGLR